MGTTIPSSCPTIKNLEETPEQVLIVKQHFQIEYAVFFNYETTSNLSHIDCLNRPSKKKKHNMISKGGGNWLSSSSSSASLFLFSYTSQSPLVLLISLAGRIHEEHFISKLHFSWPQMSCVSQSPTRGSRVVVASYKDSVGQIQKFAMRFLNSVESQSFFNTLKESLNNVENIEAPCNNVLSGIQPENELIHLDEVHHSTAVELNPIGPAGNSNALVPPSVNHGVEDAFNGGTSCPANYRSTDGYLPSSFIAFLNDGSKGAPEDATEPLEVPKKADLFSHLVKDLAEPDFHVMLGKLDKFIKDIGGDMALQWS